MAEPAAAAADAAQGAVDTVKEGAGKLRRAAGWSFNQFHPFGANGKLGRTFNYTSMAALVGAGVVMTGGAAAASSLPFSTALGSTMTAASINAGALTATTATAQTAAVGTTIATSGIGSGSFLGTAWGVGTDFTAHAANGAAFLGGNAWDIGSTIATNADWDEVSAGISTVQTGLTGGP
jgi:hypothetical protein